jgi:hypothetical protein
VELRGKPCFEAPVCKLPRPENLRYPVGNRPLSGTQGTTVPVLYSLPVPGDKNKTEKLQYPCGIILRFYGLTTYVKISANLCLSSFDLLSIIAEYLDVCKLFHSFTEQDGLWERSCAAYKFKSLFAITKTRGSRFLKSPACVLSVVVLFGVW